MSAASVLRSIEERSDEPELGQPKPMSVATSLAEHIVEGASVEQTQVFFHGAGRRLAAARPVPPECDLAGMTMAINHVWASVGLGEVSLELCGDGIEADHRFGDLLAGHTAGRRATIAFLEGCYDGWFHDVGGSDRLWTRLLLQTADRVKFRYGL